MKLNADCIRDVMICIEENLEYNTEWTIKTLHDFLPEYTFEELSYTCQKLNEGGLLNVMTVPMMSYIEPQIARVQSLTFDGHEYLETIRSPKIWQQTKEYIKSTSLGVSIAVIGEIAKRLTLKSINI